jgi:hypothetical protein
MRVAAALVVDKKRGKAREQDLAMLPSKPAADASAAPRAGAAALAKELGERLPKEQLGERLAKAATPRAGDAPITQADLKRFVDETLAKGARSGCWGPGRARSRQRGRRSWACGIVFVLKSWAGAPSDVV